MVKFDLMQYIPLQHTLAVFGWDDLIYLLIMMALSYAASVLLAPDAPETPLDDSKSAPSIRGTLSSFLMGRMRVGPVIGYVGDRLITKESAGGGKGGGGDGAEYTIYHEAGMHIISTGLGKTIRAIYQAGENILNGEISSDTTASGDTIDLGKEGSFRVYWGTPVQPVDTGLANRTGLSSSFPSTFYVVWDRKRLGQQARWPQIEYDVEVTHPTAISIPSNGGYIKGSYGAFDFSATIQPFNSEGQPLMFDLSGYTSALSSDITSPFAIKTSDASAASLPSGAEVIQSSINYTGEVVNVYENGVDYIIMLSKRFRSSNGSQTKTFDYSGVPYSGVNPASALYQLFFAEFPHGLGWDQSRFELSDFDTLATLFSSTELSPCTVLLRSGKSFQTAVSSVLQDFGIQIWLDTSSGKLRLSTIREGGSTITLTTNEFMNSELSKGSAYAVLDPDTIVYSFFDSARKFTSATITINDDAGAAYSDNPNTKKIQLNTVTDFTTASMVVSRRETEVSIDEMLSLDIPHTLADMDIGQTVTFDTLPNAYRLFSKKLNPDSAKVECSFGLDVFSVSNNYREIQGTGANPTLRMDPTPDLYVGLLETNRILNKDLHGFYATRIRYGGYIVSSELYTSADNVSYSYIDKLFYGTGGTLSADLSETPTLVEDGIFIDIAGSDITSVRDLVASPNLWRGGSQLAIIGSEICFLQGINVGTGELVGLIRARYGTHMQEHPAGTPVFILNEDTLNLYQRNFLVPEAELYIKSLPYSSTAQVSPDEVSPESITYKGGGFRPLSCENLTTTDGTDSWESGDDVYLRWSYKNANDAGAAGLGLSDEASPAIDPEGTFRLDIRNGPSVVRTVEQTSPVYTYSYTNLVSDFGGEPSAFEVDVYEVLNGLTSEVETATITRV